MCGVLCAACQCSLLLFLLGLLRLWFFLGFYAIHNISFVFFFFVHLFFVSIFILLPFPSLALFCSLLIYVRISFRVRWFFYVYHGIWVCLCVYGSLLHRLDLLFAIYTELHMSSITACVSHCIVWSNLLHIYLVRLFVWSVLTLSYPLFSTYTFHLASQCTHRSLFTSFHSHLHLHLCVWKFVQFRYFSLASLMSMKLLTCTDIFHLKRSKSLIFYK